MILVDEPPEHVPPANIARVDRDRLSARCEGRGEAESAVRSPAVEVLAIGPERPVEMPPPPDQRPVEALRPDRLDHPFRIGVRVRSLDRGADHPHALRAEHRVERPDGLRVPVPDEEPRWVGASVEPEREVARLLGHPRRVRVCRRRAEVDPPAAELDEHEAVERPEPGGLDREEVTGDDALRLGPEELGPLRRGAGPARAVRSKVLIVVALALRPSLRSSPWIRTQPQRGFSRASLRMSSGPQPRLCSTLATATDTPSLTFAPSSRSASRRRTPTTTSTSGRTT